MGLPGQPLTRQASAQQQRKSLQAQARLQKKQKLSWSRDAASAAASAPSPAATPPQATASASAEGAEASVSHNHSICCPRCSQAPQGSTGCKKARCWGCNGITGGGGTQAQNSSRATTDTSAAGVMQWQQNLLHTRWHNHRRSWSLRGKPNWHSSSNNTRSASTSSPVALRSCSRAATRGATRQCGRS